MYLLSQIKRNPAITTVTKRGIFGGRRGLLSSSLRNIKALLIYESGSLGSYEQVRPTFTSSLNPIFFSKECDKASTSEMISSSFGTIARRVAGERRPSVGTFVFSQELLTFSEYFYSYRLSLLSVNFLNWTAVLT